MLRCIVLFSEITGLYCTDAALKLPESFLHSANSRAEEHAEPQPALESCHRSVMEAKCVMLVP